MTIAHETLGHLAHWRVPLGGAGIKGPVHPLARGWTREPLILGGRRAIGRANRTVTGQQLARPTVLTLSPLTRPTLL